MDYWTEAPGFSSAFHFKWQPISKGIRFEQLSMLQRQAVNHFECHGEVTTKDALFRNLFVHAESHKLNVFDCVPLTFVLDVDSADYAADYERFLHCYNIIDGVQNSLSRDAADYWAQCVKQINQRLSQQALTKDKRAIVYCKAKIHDTHIAGHNIWILKPTGFNRGRGVAVFDTIEKLRNLLKFYSEGVLEGGATEVPTSSAKEEKRGKVETVEADVAGGSISNLNNLPSIIKSRAFVIQKYVERPLLIKGRKFDIRVWCLVSYDMKVYFFKEGYLRTSCEAYTTEGDSIDKRNVHLTNNAVQKYCANYGAFEDGNQLSFRQFQVRPCF
jgi:hypothetical protein